MTTEIFEWVTPDGTVYNLTDGTDGAVILRGPAGRFMPPIRRTDQTVPLTPGQRLRSVLHDQSEVTLPVRFTGPDLTGLRAVLRSWVGRFDPTRGDGTLRVTGPAGDVRDLTCRYQDGMELTEDASSRFPSGDQLAVLTFVASDPYWADATDSQSIWTAGTPRDFFPFFPIRLGASESFGVSTITNVGDVDTYPVWVIAGPAPSFVLSNITTGRTLAWSGALGSGELMVVDCRPGNQSTSSKSVFKNDGSNQFAGLASRDFWPLVPGAQQVEVQMSGAAGPSQITAIWRPRYLSS